MSDILSLLGYDIRGEELRAAAAHSRLVRDAREARRAERGRRGLLDAIRDRLSGRPEPAAGAPVVPAVVGDASTGSAHGDGASTGSAHAADSVPESETLEQPKVSVGSRG